MVINLKNIKRFISIFFTMILIIRPQILIKVSSNFVWLFTFLQVTYIIWHLIIYKKISIGRDFLLPLLAFYFYDFINTYIQNNSSIPSVIISGIWAISTVFIIRTWTLKFGCFDALKTFSKALSVLIWLNLLLRYLYPRGLTQVMSSTGRPVIIHLLGQHNQLTVILMLSLALFICCVMMAKTTSITFTIYTLFPIALTAFGSVNGERSTTGMIGFSLIIIGFTLLWFFPNLTKKLVRPGLALIIIVLLFIFLTRILSIKSISDFIINVLQKDITLSERTSIWSQTYVLLSNFKTLMFGFGESSGGNYVTIWTGNSFSAHNLILQIVLQGGLILLAIFLIILQRTINSMALIQNEKKRAFLSVFLFAFLFDNMMEVYSYALVVAVLYVLYLSAKYLCGDNHFRFKEQSPHIN